jgi:DoxX-like family
MKKANIFYWISTIIIVLFEGVMPAFTWNTPLAQEGMRHLGYPSYFGGLLVIFKVGGALLLLIPQVPPRVKEWAYVGFAFDFIFAFLSLVNVDGPVAMSFFPLIIFGILIVSYVNYHRRLKFASTGRPVAAHSVTATA